MTPGKPWAGGTCIYAYHTDANKDYTYNVPPVCPNGLVDVTLQNISLSGQVDYYGLTYPGYNYGACNLGALGIFQSSNDNGYPNFNYDPNCPAGTYAGPNPQ